MAGSSEFGIVFQHPSKDEFDDLAWLQPTTEPTPVFSGTIDQCERHVEDAQATGEMYVDRGANHHSGGHLEVRRLIGGRSLYDLTEPL